MIEQTVVEDKMEIEALTRTAEAALVSYGFSETLLRIVKGTNNTVFEVVSGNSRYVLRVHRPGYRKLEWIESELEWLRAINNETNLCAPQPAAPVYHGRVGEKPVYCTLLTWLEGQQKTPSQTTEQDAYGMGVFAGQLHAYSARFAGSMQGELPSLDFERRLADMSVFDEDGLLSKADRAVLNEFIDEFRVVITKIEEIKVLPIHADLIWKNFLHQESSVCAIDFDDCTLGIPLYDLAPLLLGFLDEKHYSLLKQAVWEGYTSILPQPGSKQHLLEHLIAARFTLSIYWIAANRHNPAVKDRAKEIIHSRIQRLKHYLRTGELIRGEIIV